MSICETIGYICSKCGWRGTKLNRVTKPSNDWYEPAWFEDFCPECGALEPEEEFKKEQEN